MKKRLSFKKRIIINFSIIIAVFAVITILFEYNKTTKERKDSLELILENNADIIYNYLTSNNISLRTDVESIERQLKYMQPELRLTIIDWQGEVLFDNILDNQNMENHMTRPEIQKSLTFGSGSNIRLSESNNIEYLYYAKKYGEGTFIRMAIPYDLELQSFVKSNNGFLYIIILFFIVCILMMLYFMNRFTRSIRELKEFSLSLKQGKSVPNDFEFSDDEVGAVSAEIVENYTLFQENKQKLVAEREKLLQHFQYSEEGIAIFTKERKEIYANSHFLQYLNIILDKPTLEVEQLFSNSSFEDIVEFLDSNNRKTNVYSKRIEKSGKQFNVRVIIFDDESFEIYISDITRSEKTRQLKQEMTNNIAHELRTPVTSIRGYLETLIDLHESGENSGKVQNFLDRAYAQTIRLSELIQDVSLLTKIEEASDRFDLELVQLSKLLYELKSDIDVKLNEKQDNFIVEVEDSVAIYGSSTLLYSIFRNLTDNALSYAGNNIDIVIRCYSENEDNYFIEFYDTGIGVEEKHLSRIFERFYRLNEGRTRNSGGSGLGLSIVRNAVLFHKGSITVRNRTEGGLSFLMTFPKTKQ